MNTPSAEAEDTGLSHSFALAKLGSSAGEAAFGEKEVRQLRREFPGAGFAEIVGMFKEEGRIFLQQMTTAVDGWNADGVRRAAHALRGGCANFGALPLEALCHEMEMSAGRGNLAHATSLLEPLRAEFLRLEIVLEQECAAVRPS